MSNSNIGHNKQKYGFLTFFEILVLELSVGHRQNRFRKKKIEYSNVYQTIIYNYINHYHIQLDDHYDY